MPSDHWDEPFGHDEERQCFTRTTDDRWRRLDGATDDVYVLDTILNHRPEMRFRLVYDGPLVSAQTKHKSGANVWQIRRALETQLAELWTFKPALLGLADTYAIWTVTPDASGNDMMTIDHLEGTGPPEERNRMRLRSPIQRGGRNYLPIVRSDLFLTCTLDILFLRKDNPGDAVSNAGDLDNRIKCLFDGLRPPDNSEQAPDDLVPEPFHCLLEDDRLITSFAIRTDRLLHRPGEPENSVMLVIDVVITPSRVKQLLNSSFTWD